MYVGSCLPPGSSHGLLGRLGAVRVRSQGTPGVIHLQVSGVECPRSAQKPLARACVKDQPVKSLEETNHIDQTVVRESKYPLWLYLRLGRQGWHGRPEHPEPQRATSVAVTGATCL